MIIIIDSCHKEIVEPRVHAVIYRRPSSKYKEADERKRKKTSQRNIQPTEHPPKVSIICKEHSSEETISHTEIDKRQDAATYGRRFAHLGTNFGRKQERRLAVQTRSN